MNVELIDYTGAPDPWRAPAIMIFTKNTRVEMSRGALVKTLSMRHEETMKELAYMANTIPSSWEFADFTFLLSDVTRAFTHQLVRSRNFSFAQQSMQVFRVDNFGYYTGRTVADDGDAKVLYEETMRTINKAYVALCDLPGVAIEDARGVLPTNILNSIVMKGNLRSYADLLRKRASPRNMGAVHGEWAMAIGSIKERMIEACPWTDLFVNRTADVVASDGFKYIESLPLDKNYKTNLYKIIDQLQTNTGGE